MSDGRQFRHHAPTRRGDPDNPLSDQELEDKFRELADGVLDEEAQTALISRVWAMEQQSGWVL